MVKACCVVNCHNRTHDRHGKKLANDFRFFSFPTWKKLHGAQMCELSRRRRVAWVSAVRRNDITFNHISRNMFVCSQHFHKGKPAYEMLECDPDWAPSLHLGHTEVNATTCGRFKRSSRRRRASTGSDDAALLDAAQHVTEAAAEDDASHMDDDAAEKQECLYCVCRRAEIIRLLEENRRLKEDLSRKSLHEGSFEEDDVKVKYYTGLPCFVILMAVLKQLLPYMPQTVGKLSPFQMLLSTLMRLRLNLPVQHLANLFSVDRATMSTTFSDTVGALFTHLHPLVHWPERHFLQATMPHGFIKAFGNRVAVILDCFEIRIERASDLKAGGPLYSQYNCHDSHKFLIGITPQGAMSFISRGWGGDVSDKQVVESSGLLEKLQPGDVVLSDGGLDVSDGGFMCAEVKIPESEGRRQLVAKDVEDTLRVAHLRVHVEKVVGFVRAKYKILNGVVPVKMVLPCQGEDVTFLDKMVTVCCALTNMCPSVVMKH